MSDFRARLYSRYVTEFKTKELDMSQGSLKSLWKWYEFKYLPLLKGLSHDAHIVELGCGPGHLLDFLRKHNFTNLEGIDISGEQVDIAKGRGLNVRATDVFEFLTFQDGSIDAIIAIDFIEHFNKDEIMLLLGEINKALKKGGILIIATPNGEGLFSNKVIYGDFTHLSIFSPESLRQALSYFGFADMRFYEAGAVPGSAVGIVRLILWFVIKLMVNIIYLIEKGNTQKIQTDTFICFCRKQNE